MKRVNVAVIDIGSPRRNNTGWAIVGAMSRTGTDLDEGISTIASAVLSGPLALGFEAPNFVPMRENPADLTRPRDGERDRAFSAGAGAAVLVTGTVVVPYVLGRLRRAAPSATATLDWQGWPHSDGASQQMLLFEAFVSNKSADRATRHIDDAVLAAQSLQARLSRNEIIESDVKVDRAFNILGAMMMRTGWTDDASVLAQACLVIKPTREHGSSPRRRQ